ncbi:pyridoxine 5'-phosphate synthase [Escherichia coli]
MRRRPRPLPGLLGLKVNAGHGLTYHNVKAIAAIPDAGELRYRSCHYWW